MADTPGPVVASVQSSVLYDDGRVHFSAEVRDKTYQPLPDAQVEAHILGPGGIAAAVPLTQDPNTPGEFQGEWTAEKPGSYTSEVVAKRGDEEIGRDVLAFERVDGVAENFHTEQNRELLEKLATETGGRVLAAAGHFAAAERDFVLGCGDHHPRDQRFVEHADCLFADPGTVRIRMAAAAEVGNRMRRVLAGLVLGCVLFLCASSARGYVLRHRGGPRGRTRLRAALHRACEGSRHTVQGFWRERARLHAERSRRHTRAPQRHARPSQPRG